MSDAIAARAAMLRVEKSMPGYWRATIDNPPINLLGPDLFVALRDLLDEAEADPEARVIVFDSADADNFISHLDVPGTFHPETPPPANLQKEWPGFIARLARSRIVSIVKLRGRVRGVGNEFVLACDMRFASRETAILAQPEVGFGVVPGGGGIDWLPRIVGRPRALEIMLGSTDYDADTAERYGWVNRAIADAMLDEWVDDLARRIATFDATAIATAKRLIDARSVLAGEAELRETFDAIAALAATPAAQERMGAMTQHGWGKRSEAELWQVDHLSPYGKSQSLRPSDGETP